MTPGDVTRRLPAVTLIDSAEIREATIDLISEAALEYFWTAPAASSYKHHNPFCCSKRGLWIHTLMVATAYERFVDSYTVSGQLTDREADRGRAAVLLHDLRKYGASYTADDAAATDHDIRCASLIETASTLDQQVADAVATHMGPFDTYEGPTPETPLQVLVHQADMAASTKNGTWGIYEPPSELVELYPSLPQAALG